MRMAPFKIIGKIRGIKYRKTITFFIIIIIGIFAATNIYKVSKNSIIVFDELIPEIESLNEYEIDATFYEEEMIIEGTEKITYINKSPNNIKAIYFHIYPNVFRNEETVPFSKNEMGLAYIDGFESGYINIGSVKSTKNDLSSLIIGKGKSILKVNLDKELEPGEKTKIYIDFMLKIPPACGRFGYGKNSINLGNWYPIAAVIDNFGWNLEPYYPIGDPFFSDVSNYRVVMMMPPNYSVASTGDLIKKESIGGKYRWTFEASKVRDFAVIASDKYKVIEDEVEDISVRSYYFEDESAELSLKAAKDSIEIFNSTFGKYPYKHFSVAASDFFVGGMEYPKLVFIDEGIYKGNDEILEYVIVHETAHQWWYGLVGNNEVKEAWLDEALTEYSTLLYYEKKYGKEKKDKVYKKMILSGYDLYRNFNKLEENEAILKALGDFKNSREYQALVYCKGTMFLECLREEMGDDVFFDALKVYFDKYKYKNATTEDFMKVCEMVSDKDLKDVFDKWLMGESD
ncbi:M1 family metallopeptidase [Wukongibacter baidiensis]|uniref:M1 family metallopeptidase n=1 Tax=Wukongibacter baidiensis TaxID=1723361 RepID=UPI003D7F58AA